MKKGSNTIPKPAFGRLLLKWNREQNDRKMPWKGEKDPYRIWLSEIILQQTRVEQGLDYYNRFIRAFPDVHSLAKAPETKVFKYWEGLGYYTRCRNLIVTANYISKELKGKFPDNYHDILTLKGVGPYTAAALSSFAFNLPHAVLDGNVFRVLARVFGIDTPVDSTEGKKLFSALAGELLDKKQPGLYNQAIMDFGATVCKPAAPLCTACVFKKQCFAFINNKLNELPIKEKKITIRKRWFYYLVLEYKNLVAIRRRTGKDIWQGLYEFPLIETGKPTVLKEILLQAEKKKWLEKKQYDVILSTPLHKQQLSHQLIQGRLIRIRLKKTPQNTDWSWTTAMGAGKFAFPRFINHHIKKITGELRLR